MGDLSAHFSRAEFRDRRTGQAVEVDPALVRVLEGIRSITGRPLRIVSGYRSPGSNAAVGGARRSQHMTRPLTAADIGAGRATEEQARRHGAVGVGLRGRWVTHVDVRKGRRATWRY